MPTPPPPTWTATPTPGLQLNSVAVSPDGALALTGTSNEFSTGQFGFYCYNGAGALVWQVPVTGANATQGVFWVAVSANKAYAAAGGESADGVGFLTICRAGDGTVLFSDGDLPGRVNQLSFSDDGRLLLAGFSDALRLYRVQPDGTFGLRSIAAVDSQFDCTSALLAADGSRAWLAAINYNTQPYTGLVESIDIKGGLFAIVTRYPLSTGAMRIAVTADGRYAAASLHGGGCALFGADQAGTPKWTYTPTLPNLSLAYAVGITQTLAGSVVVACGTNQENSEAGYLYVVDSVPSTSQIAVPAQWTPKLRWTAALEYSANPGVCLDREATRVTATDGKPKEKTPHGAPPRTFTDITISESPGNFYLYDGTTGARLWQYPTKIMNWPMAITPDGAVALGGSDDGSLYYWKLG
jgi:hypothetical protein